MSNYTEGMITGGYKIKKPKESLPLCVDCKNLKTEVILKRTCKKNYVSRSVTDTCCWSGKRYPSKFEPKEEERNDSCNTS